MNFFFMGEDCESQVKRTPLLTMSHSVRALCCVSNRSGIPSPIARRHYTSWSSRRDGLLGRLDGS